MTKRLAIGLAMMLAGLGLLTPPVWMLCSPFLAYSVEASGSGMTAWLGATLAGMTLLVIGVRRLIPVRAGRSQA
jgi:hypothetical protein